MRSRDESVTPWRMVLLLIAAAGLGFGVAFATGVGVKRASTTPTGYSSAPLLSSPRPPTVSGLALGETLPDLRPISTQHKPNGTTKQTSAGATTTPSVTSGSASSTPPSTHTTPPTTTQSGGGGGGGGDR